MSSFQIQLGGILLSFRFMQQSLSGLSLSAFPSTRRNRGIIIVGKWRGTPKAVRRCAKNAPRHHEAATLRACTSANRQAADIRFKIGVLQVFERLIRFHAAASLISSAMICDQLKKADIARIKVEMRALELGVICNRPVLEGTRYDCILDTGGRLYRAQVKYADGKVGKSSGAVQVSLRKEIRKDRNHAYLESEIDVLLVYIPKIDRVCWFGPEVFNGRPNLCIRISPARNGQLKGCLPAGDYLW